MSGPREIPGSPAREPATRKIQGDDHTGKLVNGQYTPLAALATASGRYAAVPGAAP
jgi:hypothetical protein